MEAQGEQNKEFVYVRYSTLIDLWNHHNGMQLQWPAVIVGASLLVLSSVIPGKIPKILNHTLWGRDSELVLVVGLPMMLVGIGLVVLLNIMRRARKIMGVLENEISEIEKLSNIEKYFKDINHPRGVSGAKLLWFYLLIGFALPIMAFGTLFSFGLKYGFITLSFVLLFCLAWPAVRMTKKTASRVKRWWMARFTRRRAMNHLKSLVQTIEYYWKLPETKEALANLTRQGIPEQEALRLINRTIVYEILEALKQNKTVDQAKFVETLHQLPELPSGG